MRRRSYTIIGAEGSVHFELERNGTALEVSEVDRDGFQTGGVVIVHEWDQARDKAADLIAEVVRSGRVG